MTTRQEQRLKESALKLAYECRFERGHAEQVQRLSLLLFDSLISLHGLSGQERFFLEIAALLHDIGWVEGQQGHHKASLRFILSSPVLDASMPARKVIGSIARYHRGSLPKKKHSHFSSLPKEKQKVVLRLAALLKVADGLDYAHTSAVRTLSCRIGKKTVTIVCSMVNGASREIAMKTDLFEKVFKRKVRFRFV